uniref:Beta-diguetoxin-Dc1a n=1 Tax=Diguetia canities TaxID=38407 RepID=TXI92_DIGCA|nr:RecName: Full=Beta-diguetoxin-Dc1a; Short=Beta-DGTX-Dc1a; Short=Dc1a; AltName: Full=Insecticidal toxin DTX9.2; Flags: Precursor [Diguetia canities]AAB60253.1 toxin DTX9.2 precursor [Diguetia canities]
MKVFVVLLCLSLAAVYALEERLDKDADIMLDSPADMERAKDGDVEGPAGCKKYDVECDSGECCQKQYLWYKWRPLDCRCLKSGFFSSKCVCRDV